MENKKPCSLFSEQGLEIFWFFELDDFLLLACGFLDKAPETATAAERDDNVSVVSHRSLNYRSSSHERVGQ